MAKEHLSAFWDEETARADASCGSHAAYGTVTQSATVVDLRDQIEKSHFQRVVQFDARTRVLDLGGGAGRFALWLAPHVAEVTVVDTSAALLRVGREEALRRGIANVRFVQGSALEHRPSKPCDLVLVMGMATHLSDDEIDMLFQRCADALVPGGRLVLKEPVSTDSQVRSDERCDESGALRYRAWFRPGERYTRAASPELCLIYRAPTCAHPIPWFMQGTNEAADSVRGVRARLLSLMTPAWVTADPALQRIEARVRGDARTGWMLAEVPVLQELFVFAKPRAEVATRRGGPTLSVVVIAYNEEDGLSQMAQELLATLRAGTASFEVVMVDDGSTDGTYAIMQDLAETHREIRLHRHTPNRGIGGALRAGFDMARGAYLTWLPADAQIPPEVVLELLERRRLGAIVTTVYRERADHWIRGLISSSLNTMIWIRTGRIAKSGGNYLMSRQTWETHGPRGDDSMMLSTALRNNVRAAGETVVEHEIVCRPRVAGQSKVLNPSTIARTLVGLFRAGRR